MAAVEDIGKEMDFCGESVLLAVIALYSFPILFFLVSRPKQAETKAVVVPMARLTVEDARIHSSAHR
jgi:preprotein translocase subunit YajC